MFHFKPAALALSVGFLISVVFTPLANAYDNLTDLGLSLGVGSASEAYGINDLGQVVGISEGSTLQAILWNGTTPTVLNGLGGAPSAAYGINNAGQVVGTSQGWVVGGTQYIAPKATIWNGTTATDLGSLGVGGTYSGALAINNSGQVVGRSNTTGNNIQKATIWNGTTATDLGSLGGTYFSTYYGAGATGINNAGDVVGYSGVINSGGYDATLWNGGTPIDLGVGIANGINDAGQVVGNRGDGGGGNWHATVWNMQNGTMVATALGVGVGLANGINNAGLVVGMYNNTGALWTLHKGSWVYTELNTLINPALGFDIVDATAINNKGQIVGYGVNSFGQQDAFVLSVPKSESYGSGYDDFGGHGGRNCSPVPEPTEGALLLSGFGLFGFIASRKKSA